jgi:predicted O-linked N-acetylglucosamine transferase (SPINDLY family)
VGASLLHALHLPELVTHDLAAYEARALQLAHTPHALGHLRARLAAHRQATPLFDTARFCRHLETAFERVWQAHVDGRAPAPLHIPALP